MPRTAVVQVRSLECYGGIAKAFRHNTAQDNGCIHKSNQNRRKKKYVSSFFFRTRQYLFTCLPFFTLSGAPRLIRGNLCLSFFITITESNKTSSFFPCACESGCCRSAASVFFSFVPMRHAVTRILVEAAARRRLSLSARAFSNSGCRLEQFHRADEAVGYS